MSRQVIRDMKRSMAVAARPGASALAQKLAKESALALLERSIVFGHGRLAVIRLAMAIDSGADVTAAHWRYCEDAVKRSKDLTLQAVLRGAVAAAAHSYAAAGAPNLGAASTPGTVPL